MALKKKFIDIEAPLINTDVQLLGSKETVMNKVLRMDMSRKMRGKSLEITFKVVDKNGPIALPIRLELMKFFIRRMIRKGTSYVEDSFKTDCKDVKVTIKPFLITRKKVSRAVRNNLRNTTKDFLINYVKEKNYLDICEELASGILQRELLPKLKKVYPLSFCDLRIFETEQIEKAIFERKAKREIREEKIQEVEEIDQVKEIEAKKEDKEEIIDQMKEIEEEKKEEEKPKSAKKIKKETKEE